MKSCKKSRVPLRSSARDGCHFGYLRPLRSAEIGAEEILPKLAGQIVVTEAVYEECLALGAPPALKLAHPSSESCRQPS